MAQIVHDVAPGAKIQFHTAYNGEADFAQGIIDLKNAGSRVIVDDIGYLEEPFFQDGVVAQAVDTVVAAGVSYFSAAGNDARQSYYDDFRPGQVYANGIFPGGFFGGTAHDFDPGAGVDAFQKITCHAGDELADQPPVGQPLSLSRTAPRQPPMSMSICWIIRRLGFSQAPQTVNRLAPLGPRGNFWSKL